MFLDQLVIKYAQSITASLLYCAQEAIDSTMLSALNELDIQEAKLTEHTKTKYCYILD